MKKEKILFWLSVIVCLLEAFALCVAFFPGIVNHNNTICVFSLLIMPAITFTVSLLWLISTREKRDKKMLGLTLGGMAVAIVAIVMSILDFGVLTGVIHGLPVLLIALLAYWCIYYKKQLA